mgnify:FL=1|jgi:hypothetical protein|nr:MAG: Protein of unknown function (DUF1040) [Bacteriophage sp.]UVX91155.1 MAG: Protein of unknown function (DUF1040) [Bacteriophage sp.]DAW05340.1 MAG TPA: Protein of unknown function (DUF1040) [Caudoviricetes sp.]
MTENQVNSWGDKISMRYESNQKIIEILSKLVERFPQWRFQQILQNVDIASRDGEDLFYEESYDTLTTLINNPTVSAILSQTDN